MKKFFSVLRIFLLEEKEPKETILSDLLACWYLLTAKTPDIVLGNFLSLKSLFFVFWVLFFSASGMPKSSLNVPFVVQLNLD